MLREVLTTGAIRLRTDDDAASFVFTRIRPSVLWVVATGRDTGAFGDATVAELSAELARFPPDLELFIDATRVQYVSNTARAAWTQWFEARRDELRRVHVLTASRYMHLAVSMSRHESRTSIEVHADAAAFAAAMRSAAPSWTTSPEQVLAARAVPIERVDEPGLVILGDGACSFTFRRAARDALLVQIAGTDRGILTSEVLNELARVRAEAGRLHLFVDLRAAQMPGVVVSDLWTHWFSANRASLASVVLLAPTSPLYVTASIAHVRSQIGALMRVVEDAQRFEAAIRRVAPAFADLPAAR
jgi:hypothetical protein